MGTDESRRPASFPSLLGTIVVQSRYSEGFLNQGLSKYVLYTQFPENNQKCALIIAVAISLAMNPAKALKRRFSPRHEQPEILKKR